MYAADKAAYDNARAKWNGSAANVNLLAGTGALTVDDTYSSTANWDGITYLARKNCTPVACFAYVNVYLNYYYTRNYPSSVRTGVAAHELGHAIGLGHANGCVLMTATTPTRQKCGVSGPTSDDVKGVNHLY